MEPFKNLFNTQLIHKMSDHIGTQWAEFDKRKFNAAAGRHLDDLELKARSNQITQALVKHLPDDFECSAEILHNSLGQELGDDLSTSNADGSGLAGWAIMPLADYVALQGQQHFDVSMGLLKEMTKRFSSEFAIRHFILANPKKTLQQMKAWTKDANPHVRRLVSEGSRPRLPWGIQLTPFIDDPSPLFTLLEALKDDESEYVRRSVANNLNDIAKDHPDVVSNLAKDWLEDATPQRKKLVKHACRTLIKQGHQKTLRSFGYKKPKFQHTEIKLNTPKVTLGEHLGFTLTLSSKGRSAQPLLIDYVIHHRKANGSLSPKVFKWTTKELLAGSSLTLTRKHPMKKITTRTYYPGEHKLEVLVNGYSMGEVDFKLLM